MAARHLQLRTSLAFAKGAYTVAIDLGAERRRANVLLDTGSSTLVVLPQAYDPNRDRHLQTTTLAQEVRYGAGQWAGPVLASQLAFGEGAHARELRAAQFALVETAAQDLREADGILGLAYARLDHAHDFRDWLPANGHADSTWPWPFAATGLDEFRTLARSQPRATLTPAFTELEEEGVVADKFALVVRRALVHVLQENASAHHLAADPLNAGTLVLGGGEECEALYHGGFTDLRIVHDLYYNANLIAVQVGDRDPIAAPPLQPEYASRYASNAIFDTGSSFVLLQHTLYDAVLADLAAHDARASGLIEHFGRAFADERGIPNEAVATCRWPDLHFLLEGADGDPARVTVTPGHYWQHNALHHGEAFFVLMRQLPNWPDQSILGLPLLCGRYCVFDRRAGGTGVLRIAKARENA